MHPRSSIQIALAVCLIQICLTGAVLAGSKPKAQIPTQNLAQYLGSFHWVMDKPWFGGWSGIEVSPDGSGMTAITDRGRLIRARIERDKGRITDITPLRWWRLKSSSGKYLSRGIHDSEGLAIGNDAAIHVSFEGVARVARYRTPSASASVLWHHKTFKTLPINSALEALAIDENNRLYTIPEQLGDGAAIRVFVMDNGTGDSAWHLAFTLPGDDDFLPVGADFGPNGQFYLLERGWNVFGFRTRVRRWSNVSVQPRNEQLLVLTQIGTHDNLEGLAVWQDKQGQTRLTMIADDNFLSLQKTEIVEYAISE